MAEIRANDSYAWTAHYKLNRNYGANGFDQLTSAGATALGYDGRGNLTTSGTGTYSYTSENRLASGPGGAMRMDRRRGWTIRGSGLKAR
ncbi:MAG: hypothetical protein J0M19_06080 [Sphingomonadales bacterium]|nr:hypothetical protein [Sphingomonadales bacterium]